MHPKRSSLRRTALLTFLFLTALTTIAFSQTFTVLHTFNLTDGEFPYGGLIRGSDGNFYGTTFGGGAFGGGTVFRLSPGGFTLLHSFAGGNTDGANPQASVIRDASGNLYGTTYFGGPSNAGTVFKIDSTNHESMLYAFTGGADGGGPTADLVRDTAGNLYGTTAKGGDIACDSFLGGCGTVFKIDLAGNETVLHTFESGRDGQGPFGGLVMDSSGNLYGTTEAAGLYGAGTVFKIDTGHHRTVLYSFGAKTDGNSPRTDLTIDPHGPLYGTTYAGGDLTACLGIGCGTVFQIDSHGVEMVVHSFENQPADGAIPSGPVTVSAGNIYGVTVSGGAYNSGSLFKIDSSGNETLVYSFTGGADGAAPSGRLFVSNAGVIFGAATISNGNQGYGVLFKITP